MDHKYQPKTVLLDEVKAGECYEIVIPAFTRGSLIRYRIGDMIRITSLRNENLGISLPQMVFERRADDLLDFALIRLTEKTIWKAIENTGIPYHDWIAFKKPGETVLNVLIEPGNDYKMESSEIESVLYEQLLNADQDSYTASHAHDVLSDMVGFKLKLSMLPRGSFAAFSAQKQSEGSDPAHLKPQHVNPPEKVLSFFNSSTIYKSKQAKESETKENRVPVG